MKTKMAIPIAAVSAALLLTGNVCCGQAWTYVTNWYGVEQVYVAVSADGKKLLAAGNQSFSFLFTDWGATWVPRTNIPYAIGVASSADGSKLAAGWLGLYNSQDAGVTWTTNYFGGRRWAFMASSADGNRLVAAPGLGSDGPIFTSTNAGASWVSNNTPMASWNGVASSADGNKLVAVARNYYGGVIFTSTNAGVTWVSNNVPGLAWTSVASSADGNRLVAVGQNVVYASADGGGSWVSNSLASGNAVASSADGVSLAVLVGGAIYTSTNAGVAWMSNSAPALVWSSIALSADGNTVVIAGSGSVYISRSTPAPVLTLTPAGTNAVVSWLIPSLPFTLQQNPDLTTTNWTAVTNLPVLNLTNLHHEVTLPLPAGNIFYRPQSGP